MVKVGSFTEEEPEKFFDSSFFKQHTNSEYWRGMFLKTEAAKLSISSTRWHLLQRFLF